ncbi:hypothetical protein PCE1_000025 [Barthelona sp. PCE]
MNSKLFYNAICDDQAEEIARLFLAGVSPQTEEKSFGIDPLTLAVRLRALNAGAELLSRGYDCFKYSSSDGFNPYQEALATKYVPNIRLFQVAACLYNQNLVDRFSAFLPHLMNVIPVDNVNMRITKRLYFPKKGYREFRTPLKNGMLPGEEKQTVFDIYRRGNHVHIRCKDSVLIMGTDTENKKSILALHNLKDNTYLNLFDLFSIDKNFEFLKRHSKDFHNILSSKRYDLKTVFNINNIANLSLNPVNGIFGGQKTKKICGRACPVYRCSLDNTIYHYCRNEKENHPSLLDVSKYKKQIFVHSLLDDDMPTLESRISKVELTEEDEDIRKEWETMEVELEQNMMDRISVDQNLARDFRTEDPDVLFDMANVDPSCIARNLLDVVPLYKEAETFSINTFDGFLRVFDEADEIDDVERPPNGLSILLEILTPLHKLFTMIPSPSFDFLQDLECLESLPIFMMLCESIYQHNYGFCIPFSYKTLVEETCSASNEKCVMKLKLTIEDEIRGSMSSYLPPDTFYASLNHLDILDLPDDYLSESDQLKRRFGSVMWGGEDVLHVSVPAYENDDILSPLNITEYASDEFDDDVCFVSTIISNVESDSDIEGPPPPISHLVASPLTDLIGSNPKVTPLPASEPIPEEVYNFVKNLM